MQGDKKEYAESAFFTFLKLDSGSFLVYLSKIRRSKFNICSLWFYFLRKNNHFYFNICGTDPKISSRNHRGKKGRNIRKGVSAYLKRNTSLQLRLLPLSEVSVHLVSTQPVSDGSETLHLLWVWADFFSMAHQWKVWLAGHAYQDPSHNQTDLLVEVLELTL